MIAKCLVNEFLDVDHGALVIKYGSDFHKLHHFPDFKKTIFFCLLLFQQ